ncbi:MAG: chorismate mutase [Chloroflexota bacterium]|nr:chorismate mutase [Chloroflexota bacterium]MDE2946967.1 chorismate mutase [Chloroflexota bacterium]
MIRGVRGATTVEHNSTKAIISATQELLGAMIDANGIAEEDVASILFTATPGLDAAYPAAAARELGWTRTALMGFQEAHVIDGLQQCVRVLIHWNTDKPMDEIQHVFLRDAVQLRPDLSPSDGAEDA